MKKSRLMAIGASLVLAAGAAVVTTIVAAPAASADACYTWSGTLRSGSSGEGVRQLQIRVSGWMGTNEVMSIDGQYGPQTVAAVKRFQSAYGLASDGVAGPNTQNKLYELQDNDCTPIHFTFAEGSPNCGNTGSFSGGRVSAATAKANVLKGLWRAEAMRMKLGSKPLSLSSGFRSVSCNSSSGGASNSRHMYGDALDFGAGSNAGVHTQCAIYRAAKTSGFSELIYEGDHIHAAVGTTYRPSAPC